MSNVAKSVYIFGIYLLLAGLALFVFPNETISILGLPTTDEVWIHLVGLLTFILGVFFTHMAKKNSQDFFFVSMFGRAIFIVGVCYLVFVWAAPYPLLLFALVDLLGLLWTFVTYKK